MVRTTRSTASKSVAEPAEADDLFRRSRFLFESAVEAICSSAPSSALSPEESQREREGRELSCLDDPIGSGQEGGEADSSPNEAHRPLLRKESTAKAERAAGLCSGAAVARCSEQSRLSPRMFPPRPTELFPLSVVVFFEDKEASGACER